MNRFVVDVFDYSSKNRHVFCRRDVTRCMEYEIGMNESVSAAVVRAVSAVVGRKPSSIPPLSHVLDPDALDVLFDSRPGGDPRIGGRFSFVYSNCYITVDNGEYLTIQPLEISPATANDRGSSCTTSLDGSAD